MGPVMANGIRRSRSGAVEREFGVPVARAARGSGRHGGGREGEEERGETVNGGVRKRKELEKGAYV